MTSVAPILERSGPMPLVRSHDDMTDVELTWIEKQIEYWIRFGHEAHG